MTDSQERLKAIIGSATDAMIGVDGARLKLAVESVHMGLWDLDLVTDHAWRSDEHDQVFGYSSPLNEWGYDIFIRHVLPEDRELAAHSFQQAMTTGQFDMECRIVWPDASVHWIEAQGRLYRNQAGTPVRMLGMVIDINSRKRAEEERDRFFSLSMDLLCIAGMDGYFKRLNPAWQHLLGYSTHELLSHPWLDFVHPEDQAVTVAEAEKLAEGALSLYFENRYRCRDGSYKWLAWKCVPAVGEGLIYAVARDMSDQKLAEKLLNEKNSQLEMAIDSQRKAHEALKQAQSRLVQSEKLAALGQLVAGVAHEINNPLSFVINNVAVMKRDVTYVSELLALYRTGDPALLERDPDLHRRIEAYAERIDLPCTLTELEDLIARCREGLVRIQQIVKDLRDFARQESVGDVQDWADLNSGIESTLNIARGQVARRGIEIERDLAPLQPVTCRPAKINQVILNLVLNAIDACGDKGRIIVRSRNLAEGVEFQVIDNGSGIDPAIRDKIFDPFFTTKPQGKGTGLGLAISHGIVTEHGGQIRVHSDPAGNTVFTVFLPRSPPRAT